MTESLGKKIDNQNQEKFQKSLTEMLSDSKIDPKEARELLRKFDLEKKELLQISKEQLQVLKNQFGEELDIYNLVEFIRNESNLYIETRIPDENLLYEGLSDFNDFDNDKSKLKIDLQNPIKPEQIPKEEWDKSKQLFDMIKDLNIKDGNITYSKEKGIILELDTSGSNLYIKLNGNDVVITGQNDGSLFVEKVSYDEFEGFVRGYERVESKRVLEQLGFTGGLTLGGILAFSIKTGLGFLLGNIGFGLGAYRGYSLYKSYNLSRNESIQVLKENKENSEVVKSYLYLSQIGYITGYSSGVFETVDGEKISKEDLISKKVSFKETDIQKYQLIRGLSDNGYKPKFLKNGKYELDMFGLFDNSPLVFNGNNIEFSTSYFEKGKKIIFSDIKTAFEKICKINECMSLEAQIKSSNTNEIYNLSNNSKDLEQKVEKLKKEILAGN